jgi:hypothetical protein
MNEKLPEPSGPSRSKKGRNESRAGVGKTIGVVQYYTKIYTGSS